MIETGTTISSQFEGTVYYRQRGVLVLAPTFMAGYGDRTHRRPSIRLMLGCSGPFEVEASDGRTLRTRAALVSPAAKCARIEAQNANFALFDFAVASAEFKAVEPLLAESGLIELDYATYQDLVPVLIEGQQGKLSCQTVVQLFATMVERLTSRPLPPLQLDKRVMQSLQLIESLPLADVRLKRLADTVNLSSDRFRHLFKQATGSTVSQYARTTAVWRALGMMSDEKTITEVSHAVGFHDVSHFYRVYADMFGISLSEKRNIRKYRRVRCFE